MVIAKDREETIKKMLIIAIFLCFVVHSTYIALFYYLQVLPMCYFNVGSVIIYIVLTICMLQDRNVNYTLNIMYFEIIVHAIVATLFVGWSCGFGLFLICLAAITFYLPFSKVYVQYAYCVLVAILYIATRLYSNTLDITIERLTTNTITVIYLYNSIAAFILLILVAWFYNYLQKIDAKKIQEQQLQLEQLAYYDPLTKLYNRWAMKNKLEEMRSGMDWGNVIYIAIADIDNFKKVNDRYGHDCGDEVLKRIAAVLKNTAGEQALVSRWGGEEFLVAIPEDDFERVSSQFEKMRKMVSSEQIVYDNQNISVTLTIGASKYVIGENMDKTVIRADRKLYEGKQSGKNRVVYDDII